MALFTDQSVSEVADLVAYEANLPEVSSAEGIDLETKIRLAQTEVRTHLEAASTRPGNVYHARGAGWQSTGGEANLSRFELQQVVVTPPLKLWHTFQTLAIIYRDAYNRKKTTSTCRNGRSTKNSRIGRRTCCFKQGLALPVVRLCVRRNRPWIGYLRHLPVRRCSFGLLG